MRGGLFQLAVLTADTDKLRIVRFCVLFARVSYTFWFTELLQFVWHFLMLSFCNSFIHWLSLLHIKQQNQIHVELKNTEYVIGRQK